MSKHIIKLQKVGFRLEFAVAGEGEPYEEAVNLPIKTFKIIKEQPDVELRARVLVGLKRHGKGYRLYRRQIKDFLFDFDNPELPMELMQGAFKIIFTTLDETSGVKSVDTAYYPLSPKNCKLLTDSNQLAKFNFKYVLVGTGSEGKKPYSLFHIIPGGGGVGRCAGCYPAANRQKRITCSADDCYAVNLTG